MTTFADDDISNLLEAIRNDEAKIARLTAALQQAEMDMAAIWMALPKKDAEQFMVARDRVRKALEVSNGSIL